jgi:hypothetical protein
LGRLAGVPESPDWNLPKALIHLRDVEAMLTDVGTRLRLEGAEDSALATLQAGRGYLELRKPWQLGEIAVPILSSMQEDEPNRIELWDWVQKAKARALSRVLASGIPPSVLPDLDGECKTLLEEEEASLWSIAAASPDERLHLRMDLDRIRAKMRLRKALVPIMDIRDGVPITAHGLEELLVIAGIEEPVVFVDWFHAPAVRDDEANLLSRDCEIPADLGVLQSTCGYPHISFGNKTRQSDRMG